MKWFHEAWVEFGKFICLYWGTWILGLGLRRVILRFKRKKSD